MDSAISEILTAIEALLRQPPSDPAVAAAAVVLADSLPAEPPDRLDPALTAVAPHLTASQRATWVAALSDPLAKAGIISPRCVAAFLGQCAVESAGFLSMEEDLNYSAGRLCEVWPNRFPTLQDAEPCAMHPEVLANRVYAGRLGNGDPASGDGWTFRGRGLIQITGRTAYQHFAQAMGMTLDQAVEHAATQAGAADSAAWYWSVNELNALASAWSIDLMTRKINGGMAGAAERTRLCNAALKAIGA